MPEIFTFRWPHFARLQAILFYPVALMLAIETTPVLAWADRVPVAAIAALLAPYGIRANDVLWGLTAAMVAAPYLVLLLVIDRLLTIRKGYALVSILAVAAWSFAASRLSGHIARFTPDVIMDQIAWSSFNDVATGAVAAAALLLHLYPLWAGLRDSGEVADRLTTFRDPYPGGERSRASVNDLYRRRTEDFQLWENANKRLSGLNGQPQEAAAVKFLYAITWLAMVIGGGLIFFGRGGQEPIANVPVIAVPTTVTVPDVTVVAKPTPRIPSANVQTVPPAPVMPLVQRPGMAAFADRPFAGGNEAIAERGHDGHFTFDAAVNGTRMPMLFDTGASVIAIRSEDAARLGLSLGKLTYNAKVKTANGVADVAPLTIDTVSIGNITVRNVQAFVARPGALPQNLLGQAFLTRLAGYSVENNRLILKGH